MKKFIFAMFFCLALAINISNCQAANMVRVADEGAESLHNTINSALNYAKLPVAVGKLLRTANLDLPEQGLRTWFCHFGEPNAAEPYGELIFFVNGEGYVSSIKIIAYSEQYAERAGNLMGAVLFIIGMTESEINTLLAGFNETEKIQSSSAWSYAKNRNFIVMLTPRMQADDGIQLLIMATDTKNN